MGLVVGAEWFAVAFAVTDRSRERSHSRTRGEITMSRSRAASTVLTLH
jgi:hypothetical protein